MLAIVLAFLIYYSTIHWIFKAAGLAAFLALAVVSYEKYILELGAPIKATPEGEFEYIHHIVTVDEMFVLWLNREGQGHRLYTYPFNREDAAEFEEAKQQGGAGGRPMLLFEQGHPSLEPLWVPNQNVIKDY